jgi:hypothetical protein
MSKSAGESEGSKFIVVVLAGGVRYPNSLTTLLGYY